MSSQLLTTYFFFWVLVQVNPLSTSVPSHMLLLYWNILLRPTDWCSAFKQICGIFYINFPTLNQCPKFHSVVILTTYTTDPTKVKGSALQNCCHFRYHRLQMGSPSSQYFSLADYNFKSSHKLLLSFITL